MLRRTLLASAGALALAGTALAADLPSRAPPPIFLPPPPIFFAWTGLYVGINAGYNWSDSNSVDVDTAPLLPGVVVSQLSGLANGNVPVQTNGFIGGGQIGYNYQFYNSWVAGIEADIDGLAGAHGSGSATSVGSVVGVPVTTTLSATKSVDYLGTVRGRLGFLLTPTLLIFGDGGLAYGGLNENVNVVQFAPANGFKGSGTSSIANSRVGWTAGGGVEWLFAPNWSAKVEYLYYDLGSVTSGALLNAVVPVAPVVGNYATTQNTTRFNGNIVRAGLNYHFNLGGAPIVAKY